MKENKDKIKIGIIGGKGRMGNWFKTYFSSFDSFDVMISDIGTKLTNAELVKVSDVVIFSVPIGSVVQIIEEVLPHTRKGQILMDLTSVKIPASNAMLRSECEVLGLHPVFSHHAESLKGQVMVMCKERPGKYTDIFEKMFRESGAKVKIATKEEHDRMMAMIQGLTHFSSIILADCIRKLGLDVKETLEYTSPIYRIRMDMIGRIIAQDPRLYAEIEILNPETENHLKEFISSANQLFSRVKEKDIGGFIRFYEEASSYFGDFRKTALSESNYLISKMRDLDEDKSNKKR